jgi:two-component system phosphate regulon sensor histidine kinase PhoR
MHLFKPRSLLHKLIQIEIIAIIAGLLIVSWIGLGNFQDFFTQQYQRELKNYADVAAGYLPLDKFEQRDLSFLKQYADRLAQTLHCRVTIIDNVGVVLADSDVPLAQSQMIENHLTRPEVQQALQNQYGYYNRVSATVGMDLYYVARSLQRDGKTIGVLRLSFGNQLYQQTLQTIRTYLIFGSLLVLLISTVAVVLLSARLRKNILYLIQKAQIISEGKMMPAELSTPIKEAVELQELNNVIDETARKLSQNLKKLSRERRDLQTVLSSINEGIIAISPNKRIIFYNKRALQLLHINLTNPANEAYYTVIRHQHLVSLIDKFLQTTVVISDEITTYEGNIYEVVLTPFEMAFGDKIGAVLVIHDITQYKKLEQVRRDFVANVSHEFKTPLAAIRGYAETLLDWALDDAKMNRKYVTKIVKQSHHLENLVQDLLELARIERLGSLDLAPFDPLPILREVVNEFQEKARGKQQTLQWQPKTEAMQILGDPQMFRSIFVNLLDNAVKYTPEGGKIMLEIEKNSTTAVFMVCDNGIGIPQKEQSRIFERFYRVDKARSQTVEGTGLGLSIVKHMTELQQAEIWLHSRVNEGSCFYLKFKLAATVMPLPSQSKSG